MHIIDADIKQILGMLEEFALQLTRTPSHKMLRQ